MFKKNEFVIINTRGGSRGRLAQVYVYSLDSLVQGKLENVDRLSQLAMIDGELSNQFCRLSVDMFEEIFDESDINTMQDNGVLDYYPCGSRCMYADGSYGAIHRGVEYKYPIFSVKIYSKWGIAKDIPGGAVND